jgi:Polyketide cyclase / dehydrase and lipid transport
MATHERSLETEAAADRVWGIWSDTSTWTHWNPDVVAISLEGPFTAGTTGSMTTRAGGTHAIRLATVEPGRSFDLETSPIPLGRFTFHCQVTPRGERASRISQSVRIGGPLGPVYSAMMGSRIADGFEPLLQGLAAEAEGGRGDGPR